MATIFTKIIKGEIPCYKIAETENCFAFLDIRPLTKGHTLVIPKQETDYLFDLDDELTSELNVLAKKIANAIDKSVKCIRVGVLVIGTEVPHAHIHLIPFNKETELNIKNKPVELTSGEFQEIAEKIKSNLTL